MGATNFAEDFEDVLVFNVAFMRVVFCYIGVCRLQTLNVNMKNLLKLGAFRMNHPTHLTYRHPTPLWLLWVVRSCPRERREWAYPGQEGIPMSWRQFGFLPRWVVMYGQEFSTGDSSPGKLQKRSFRNAKRLAFCSLLWPDDNIIETQNK